MSHPPLSPYLPVHPSSSPSPSHPANPISSLLAHLSTLHSHQLNAILHQESKRLRLRTHHTRHLQKDKIEQLEVQSKINGLKNEIKMLRNPSNRNGGGRNKNTQRKEKKRWREDQDEADEDSKFKGGVEEYEGLREELEMRRQLYEEQLGREGVQVRQIGELQKALEDLEKQQHHLEQQLLNTQIQEEIKEALVIQKQQQIKRNLYRKQQYLKIVKGEQNTKTNPPEQQHYENILKGKIYKLLEIKEAGMERELLQNRINNDLREQAEIISTILQQPPSKPQPHQQPLPRKHFRSNKYPQLQPQPQSSSPQPSPSPPPARYKSISNLPLNPKPPTKRPQTFSIDHSSSSSSYHPLKTSNPPPPILNLTPPKYSHRYNDNQKYTAVPRAGRYASLEISSSSVKLEGGRKDKGEEKSLNVGENKPGSISAYDTSVSSSMYKNRRIEIVRESFVELATIKEEKSRLSNTHTHTHTHTHRQTSKQQQKPPITTPLPINPGHNENQSRLLSLKRDRFSKAQIPTSESANRGVPFECDKGGASEGESWRAGRERCGFIYKRQKQRQRQRDEEEGERSKKPERIPVFNIIQQL